jgi:hypothetical protein
MTQKSYVQIVWFSQAYLKKNLASRKVMPRSRGWALWQRLFPRTRRTKTRASTPLKLDTEITWRKIDIET